MKRHMGGVWGRLVALVLVVAVTAAGVMYARNQAEAAAPGIALMDPAPYLDAVVEATKAVPALDYSGAQGVNYLGTKIVRVPGNNYGGVAVQLDDKGAVVSVMEVKNTIEAGRVTSDTFVNGTQLASINLNEKTGEIVDGWVMQGDKKVPVTDDVRANVDWRCWSNCMTNYMGVPNWVIGTITALCALACIGTAGAGCITCAQVAVIFYGAEAAFCFGYCD